MNQSINQSINGEICVPDTVSFKIKHVRSIKKIQLQFTDDFFVKMWEIILREKERKETNLFITPCVLL